MSGRHLVVGQARRGWRLGAVLVLALGAVACGRFGFDPHDDTLDSTDGDGPDGAPVADGPAPLGDAPASDLLRWLRFDPAAPLLDSVTGEVGACTTCPAPLLGGPRGTLASFSGGACVDYAGADFPSDAVTVALWFRATDPSGSRTIFSKPFNAMVSTANSLEAFFEGGQFLFVTRDQAGQAALTTPFVADTTWHHVAMVRDGADATIFFDGVLAAMVTYADDTLLYAGDPMLVGCDIDDGLPMSHFDGEVADLRVYGTALAPARLAALAAP